MSMETPSGIEKVPYLPGHSPLAVSALQVPVEMVLQIATGMEEPVDIAARFGFSQDKYTALSTWGPFQQELERKRQELAASGQTFRMKMNYMATDLADDLYTRAKGHEIPLLQKLETFRTMAKLADLEPKPNTSVQSGPGFSITINFSQPKEKGNVLEQEAGNQDRADRGPGSQALVLESIQGALATVETVEPAGTSGVQRDVQHHEDEPRVLPPP